MSHLRILPARLLATMGAALVLASTNLLAAGLVFADNGPRTTQTVTNRNGIREEFTIGGNDGCTVYHRWASAPGQDPTGSWVSMGGCVSAGYGLDVGMNQNGHLEIFAIGTDYAVWHKWQTQVGSGPWSNWARLGGVARSGPTVLSEFSGDIYTRISVGVTGTDGRFWIDRQSQPGCCWGGWFRT